MASRTKQHKVTTITPNQDAWAVALRLAGKDPKRIEVRSETEVVVLNNPR